MLPFLVLLWQSDAAAGASLQQSVLTNPQNIGAASFVTGAEVDADARAYDPSAVYGIRLGGRYGRMFNLAGAGPTLDTGKAFGTGGGDAAGADAPPGSITTRGVSSDTFAANLGGDASWSLGPFSRFTMDTQGFIASRFGVRATDALAQRDPFLLGNRTEYNVGGGLSFFSTASKKSSYGFSGGYSLAGGLAAISPDAVGMDGHMVRAGVSYTHELGASDSLQPNFTYNYAHLYHAILNVYDAIGATEDNPCPEGGYAYMFQEADADRGTPTLGRCIRRGFAAIHTGTLALTWSHAISRRFRGSLTGGATLATPLPSIDADGPTARPEIRVAATYLTRTYRFEGSYAYTYTSLGPRVGFGTAHTASVDTAFRPVAGGRYRDFIMHAIGRVAYGDMPVGANPLTPNNIDGALTTLTFAASALAEYPLVRGLALTGSVDLQLTRGASEQTSPLTGDMVASTGVQLTTVFTLGLRGTIATDPMRTVPRDPEEQDALALARERGLIGPSERLEDRTREYRLGERINDPDEILDRDWNRGESERDGVEKDWNRGESDKGGDEKDWNRGESDKEQRTDEAPR